MGRSPRLFGPHLLWPNGCMDQDATWYGGRPWPTRHSVRLSQFSANVRCGQAAGWTKISLGTEVGHGPGEFVLDGDPAPPRKKGTPIPTHILAYFYSGHTAGWMKTPLGTEVDLGPGHIVLDGVSAAAKGAQQPPPSFRPCLLWPRSPISATAELLLHRWPQSVPILYNETPLPPQNFPFL